MQAKPRRPIVRLALEDGSVFSGVGFGACDEGSESSGEVVFNTAMCGYQEALTDPSYAGQILTMTAPMIGNYGVAAEDMESAKPQVAGFVIRELARLRSNHRAVEDLSVWLRSHGIIGLEGIDTRALVRTIRTRGAMRGILSCDASRTDAELVESARSVPEMTGQNLAAAVSVPEPCAFNEGLGAWTALRPQAGEPLRHRVLALDCGGKRNIYRHLVERGCEVHIVPYNLSAPEIRAFDPDGLFISNGPGDPDAVEETVAVLREIAGEYPTFGICLGHQLLALAFGARTFKLKFGHRGANQPVRNVLTGWVEITSQNHGFAVDSATLGDDLEMTHLHLNDGTLAGFRHRTKPVFAVQYHPEASPGPHDSAYLFDCFVEIMDAAGPVTGEMMKRYHHAPAAQG